MVRFVILAILVVSLGSTMCVAAETDHYEEISQAVVRLEHVDTTGAWKSAGTGFLVMYEDNAFLVTARHVAEAYDSLRARVLVVHKTADSQQVQELRSLRDGWVYHPDDGNDTSRYVDVAVTQIVGMKDWRFRKFPQDLFATRDPRPPDRVIVYGFPGHIDLQSETQRPLARGGIISSDIAERLKVKKEDKYFANRVLLADVFPFGGRSGGPVWVVLPINRITLGGMHIAGNDTLALSFITPVSRIVETIKHAIETPVPSDVITVWRPLDGR